MTEDRKNRIIWGSLLLVGALGCASLRNNPALGITPLAIAVIEGLIYVFLLIAVRLSGWHAAAVIAVLTPFYLWIQRFLDGFMIPVDILTNLTMLCCMKLALKTRGVQCKKLILLVIPSVVVMLLGSTVAIWCVKGGSVIRALMDAWNTDVYSIFSILGAALVCVPAVRREKTACDD